MAGWMHLALLSALFAALIPIFAKLGLARVDPTLATALRGVVMAAALLIAATALHKWALMRELDRSAVFWIVASGLAGAASWICYFLALRTGPATPIAALDRLSVLFVLVLAAALLGESLTWRTSLAAVLMTAGLLLIAIK